MTHQPIMPVRVVYSYSHKDSRYRERMEKALSTLRDEGIITVWSDVEILPGDSIPGEIHQHFSDADIAVFLLSDNFLASAECQREWRWACEQPTLVCVPVILKACAWRDLRGISDIKSLPRDAKPVSQYRDSSSAWLEVHNGIRDVVERVRQTFSLREPFRVEMERTSFVSQSRVRLRDLFVFPVLTGYAFRSGPGEIEEPIRSPDDLLNRGHVLIHGEHLSGKTALCRATFLDLVDAGIVPTLYVDLANLPGPATESTLRKVYGQAFTGDYTRWDQRSGKILFLDNLSRHREKSKFVRIALNHFGTVVATLATDTYYSYYRDCREFVDFGEVRIQPLTHVKQESLIRRRVARVAGDLSAQDGQIDQLEKRVNAVILTNRLLPRYPFYVLSVLQTYDGFMPHDLKISSYGHCYYVVILAHLVKSGISRSDADLGSCLNFAEHLAFHIHGVGNTQRALGLEGMAEFVNSYRKRFILPQATLRSLSAMNYGIVTEDGSFRDRYMYYYFLGRYLANHAEEEHDTLERLLNESYRTDNALTLIFTIHHTSNDRLIDAIRDRTMSVFSGIEPATLDEHEADLFNDEVRSLPERVLTGNPVEAERVREREERDREERSGGGALLDEPEERDVEVVNDLYRIFKNNEILGHILQNQYGRLERSKIEQLIEAIADGGLRLVRLLLEKKEIHALAMYLHERNPDFDRADIEKSLVWLSLLWAVLNIERVVGVLGRHEIRSTVEEIVGRKSSPAYDLIGYFVRLDTIRELGDEEIKRVRQLLRKHRYPFFKWLVSVRTQSFLTTHKASARKEQAMCSTLGIPYRPRPKRLK